MKKLILCFAMILFLLSTSAQKKWKFGMELFPNISKITYKKSRTNLAVVPYVYSESEYSPGFSFRIFANKQINDKSQLIIGLGHQSASEKMTQTSDYYTYEEVNQFIYRLNSVQLTIGNNYYFGDKFYFHSAGSFIFTYSVANGNDNSNFKVILPNREKFGYHISDNFNASVQLGLGYDLIKKANYTFYLQPTVEKMIFRMLKNIDIYNSPVMIGLIAGIKI